MKSKILVVDDEPLILRLITAALRRKAYEVICATCGAEALQILGRERINLAILDYSLPDVCGAELFVQMRDTRPELPVIFLTGYPNLETAVALMKLGVRDYLTKPFNCVEFCAQVDEIVKDVDSAAAKRQNGKRASGSVPAKQYLWGSSDAMRAVEAQIQNLPRYPVTTVLITGPTGTGKSAVARRIHDLTWGNREPFVEIDCSTIPRELCESELFGHEKGSFTGAHRDKHGLFEAAGRGTAFLDEIGELDLSLQVKFLRVIEARHFTHVGGHSVIPMQARIIAATNRSLPDLVQSGLFREDLYFRLNVVELWMPALNDRREDVPMLAQHFLEGFAARYGKTASSFAPAALDYLRNCDFPGNVRELRNMVERAVINSEGPAVQLSELVALRRAHPVTQLHLVKSAELIAMGKPMPGCPPSNLNLADLEKRKLQEALASANGNKSKAAKLVGLSRTAFHRRLQKHQARRASANPALGMEACSWPVNGLIDE